MQLSEAGLIALCGSAITALGMVLKCILRSRCSDIKVCFGLFSCLRSPLTGDELKNIELGITPNTSSVNLESQGNTVVAQPSPLTRTNTRFT
jgi:hypothetical protein